MNKKRLIKRHASYDMSHITDAVLCVAANIEDAYLQCSAIPGKDYQINDIMKMAFEYVQKTEHGKQFYVDTTIHGEQ